jgi:hypothetical protein
MLIGVLAGCGGATPAATTTPTEPSADPTVAARELANEVLSEIRSGDQLTNSTEAAMKSATTRCADGRGAPDTGEPVFDEAVAAAMKILCP